MKKLSVLILLGFLVSCNTTEPLASGEGTGSQNSSSGETAATSDTIPKLSRKQQAAKAAENTGNIQLKPATKSGDLSTPKASGKTKRN